MSERWQYLPSLFSGVPLAVLYILLAHLSFRGSQDIASLSGLLYLMSFGFIFLAPLAIGGLTVGLAPWRARRSLRYGAVMPMVASAIATALITVLAWESAICVLIALPVTALMAGAGGLVTAVLYRGERPRGEQRSLLLLFLLAPYVVTPIESRVPAPDSVRTVTNQVVVGADEAAVWREIIRVPPIQEHEQRWGPIRLLGLPRPIEATLSDEGLGAVRHASFEGGLRFVETVTEWQDRRAIGFTIVRDQASPPPAPLDGIGGPYFDVLDGRYRIEPRGDGTVILHLASTHRLSTHFNPYAGLWTDSIMASLQQDVLRVVKARAEAAAL